MADINMAKLRTLPVDHLLALNRAICTVIREHNTAKAAAAGRKFRVGDRASFVHNGRKITMQINRINTKTVGGVELTVDGKPTLSKWRVAPTLLRPCV